MLMLGGCTIGEASPSPTTSVSSSPTARPPATPRITPPATPVPTPTQRPLPIATTAFVDVEAAAEVVCGLGTNGAVTCWGSFMNGPYTLPVGKFRSLTVAGDYGCAIGTDDRLACWGMGPGTLNGTLKVAVAGESDLCGIDLDGKIRCASGLTGPAVSGLEDAFVGLSAGYGFCGVRANGNVSCWDADRGTFSPPVSGQFVAVSGDGDTGCALRKDGRAVCWQPDYGSYDEPGAPRVHALAGAYRSIAVGGMATCGITLDGSLRCWWGHSDIPSRDVPSGNYTAVAAFYNGACAVRVDQLLVCWGGSIPGQALTDSVVGVRPDVQPKAPDNVVDVSASPLFETCVVRDDQTLGCTGGVAPPEGRFLRVVTTWGAACAIRTDGSLACWDNDWAYDGSAALGRPPSGSFADVDIGDGYACGLRTSGTLVCWGQERATSAPDGTFVDVVVRDRSACGLAVDGTVRCWGEEAQSAPAGQWLAIDDVCGIRADHTLGCWTSDVVLPLPSGAFRAVHGSCGVRVDGTLACWGIGDWDASGNPVRESDPPTGAFAAVDDHCAVRVDHRLVCWNTLGTFLPGPHAAVRPVPSWVAVGDIKFSWSGSGLLPVTSFDVDASWIEPAASVRGGRWLSATSTTSATVRITPGGTYCIGVAARDTSGYLSAAAFPDECVVAALDDTSFHRSAGWTRISAARYYRSSALRTSRQGATLTVPVTGMRLALVASTCPGCGTIEVMGQTVSLESSKAADKRVIEIDLCGDEECPDYPYDMTVTIRVVSDGRPVTIDGIAVG